MSLDLSGAYENAFTAKTNGRRYRLFVDRPEAETQSTPLLFVLDGDAYFSIIAGLCRNLALTALDIAPPIVVGIGLPGETPTAWHIRRYEEYTAASPLETDPHVDPSDGTYGGLSSFLEVLTKEVPHLLNLDTSARPMGLFGHSLGGLAALEAMLSDTAFSRFISISPALWWRGHDLIHRPPNALPERTRLFLGIGELEQTPLERLPQGALMDMKTHKQQVAASAMVDNAKRLAEELTPVLGERIRFAINPGEGHVSAPYALLPPALRFCFPVQSELA